MAANKGILKSAGLKEYGECDLKKEVIWCIDWLRMELDDQADEEENAKYIKNIKTQIKQCENILLKL